MRLAFARPSYARAETAVGDEAEPLLLTLEQPTLTLRTDMREDWTRKMNLTSDLRSMEPEQFDFQMAKANKCYDVDVVVERVADDDVAGDAVGVDMTGAAVDGCLGEKKSMPTAWEVTKRTSRLECKLERQKKPNLFGYQRTD